MSSSCSAILMQNAPESLKHLPTPCPQSFQRLNHSHRISPVDESFSAMNMKTSMMIWDSCGKIERSQFWTSSKGYILFSIWKSITIRRWSGSKRKFTGSTSTTEMTFCSPRAKSRIPATTTALYTPILLPFKVERPSLVCPKLCQK